jgi:LDH2 family malate/lactate/ureidoglycolate dehydrogenase
VNFSPDYLIAVATAFLKSVGETESNADIVARNLVHADMRGIHTHGMNFLPKMAARIDAGMLAIPTAPTVIRAEDAVCHIDGGDGFGQPAADMAMDCAIERAGRYGIGMALVRNTNHIGPLSFYSIKAAEAGMVGFATCNSAPSMAPFGGTEPFFGTNPFSVASPSGEKHPITLDMSTSVVARGKIREAIKRGNPIPPDWAFSGDGTPTTDPAEAMNGTLMPVGGAKGSGMALFIDLIAGALSGSKFGQDVLTFHKPLGPTGVGSMMLAIDISRFMPLEAFQVLVREHIANIHRSNRSAGTTRIYVPGEIEAEREERSLAEGVELDEITIDEVNLVLAQRKIALRLEERHG